MGKTIYFYSVDPGSLAVMLPIVEAAPKELNCLWVAGGKSEFILRSKGTEYLRIDDLFKNKVNDLRSDGLLILGCQMNTNMTARVIEESKKAGLKTAFIFDHWSKYKEHFTTSDGRMVLPDKILAIDKLAKQKLTGIGISEEDIVVVGHPSIDETVRLFKKLDGKDRERIQKKIGVQQGHEIVLLALEPLADAKRLAIAGYDDQTTTLSVIDVLSHITDYDICLVARPHPRQDRNAYIRFLKKHNLTDKVVLCPEDVTQVESIFVSDIVLGMTSVLLIHSRAVGKPTISLQINRTPFAESVSLKHLDDIVVTNTKDLKVSLLKKLNIGAEPALELPGNGIENTWKQIRFLVAPETYQVEDEKIWQN